MAHADVYRELELLREENSRLRDLLRKHGIAFEATPYYSEPLQQREQQLTLEEKVALFMGLFRGREDVFARRWYSPKTEKSGYQPVCTREWIREYCDKKSYKCAACPNRDFKHLGYDDIYRHLEGKDPNGKDVVGVYAILPDNTCWFLCCDFDDKNCEHGYEDDVRAFQGVCKEWNIPAYIERSRSGNGAHIWILFSKPVKAQSARRLGNAILTEAMNREGRLSFKSYDRFFPNQDFLPDGGFGNLVALPLQGQSRKKGNCVFVNDKFIAYSDQWSYLKQMTRMTPENLESQLMVHCAQEPLGDLLKSNEATPLERPQPKDIERTTLPPSITIIRSSGLYIPITNLPAKAINHLKRLAAFKNPEFFRNLGMRLPTYNLPRIISCADFLDEFLIMPRGCEEGVLDFFADNGIATTIEDKTNPGKPIEVSFRGELKPEQSKALEELSKHRCGTIYAATAFGKTVTGIAMIARKKINTLILVHTKALLDQWREKFNEFLESDFTPEEDYKGHARRKKFKQIGALSSTENSLNGKIDVALLQSCINDNEVKPFVRYYGMVIVDECHHAPAFNFERVLKEINARYVYGLTATPIRKDGHQPIIFMQCGEIRYTADSSSQQQSQSFNRLLIPRYTGFQCLKTDGNNYNQVIDELIEDDARNNLIVADVAKVISEGRSPIILTARTSHVDRLTVECSKICSNVIRLVGNDSAKVKREVLNRLVAVSNNQPLVVIATGKYIGEGFDLPRLDTLMLALPVSWKGLITQYAGRLHREYPGKKEVRIYDYIDLKASVCDSMYRKRLIGYKAIGYSIGTATEGLFAETLTETIYDSQNFEKVLHTDLSSASHSIVISIPKLRWNRTPRIIELLYATMSKGVRITIIVSEVGFQESQLQSSGVEIIHYPSCKINCAVIDKSLCWYGNVNMMSRSLPDATAIRLKSSDFASALLDALLNRSQ